MLAKFSWLLVTDNIFARPTKTFFASIKAYISVPGLNYCPVWPIFSIGPLTWFSLIKRSCFWWIEFQFRALNTDAWASLESLELSLLSYTAASISTHCVYIYLSPFLDEGSRFLFPVTCSVCVLHSMIMCVAFTNTLLRELNLHEEKGRYFQ